MRETGIFVPRLALRCSRSETVVRRNRERMEDEAGIPERFHAVLRNYRQGVARQPGARRDGCATALSGAARHAPSPYRMYDKDGADNVRGNEDRERSGRAGCRTGFPVCGYNFSAIFSRRFAREPLTSTSRLRIGCSSKYRASASVSAKVR